MAQLIGNIHSIESCGTVDGPGIRYVVFMQGCPMRCLYCHNPDSWSFNVNKKMSVSEIIGEYEKVKEFLKYGGLTVTGGEPLVQMDFVTELFKQAKERKIHTALDTSGVLFRKENIEKFDELIKYTSLVLLDIKHSDSIEHVKLTGHPLKPVLDFAKYLSSKRIPVWIRHVVVPHITYNKMQLKRLGQFLSTLDNIQALDVLPYHNMAIKKYEELKQEYPLKNIPPLTKAQATEARNLILDSMRESKLAQMKQDKII